MNLPLFLAQGGEAGGALGAARLTWLADGGTVEQVCTAPLVRELFEPDPPRVVALAERYAKFRALYPALRPVFGIAA